ncbi:MAG: nucleotide exchange factor GrpE [Elusimicrobia bacterium RIFOXYB2_FULL_48_7]|nr:MAG: nucleotide exchange factor GrpE [Elusimicrobia bacterium RIFOXYB2_FULL_48_7]
MGIFKDTPKENDKPPEEHKHAKDKGLITEEELKAPASGGPAGIVSREEPASREKEFNSQLLRLRAEFDNYRTRVEKEKQHRYILGKESVLSKVLDFEDIFEKALESLRHWNTAENQKDIKNVIHGVELVKKEFNSFLKKEGVKHLDVVGARFDPAYHEVIGYEHVDGKEDGIIIKEIQKGYTYDEYVLRPSKVIVAKDKVEEAAPETEGAKEEDKESEQGK